MEQIVLGDRYELLEKIGEGGMALVYKARCRILDRIVAVKVLKEEYSQNKNFVEKFKVEALAAARISHPNIVNIYDVGQQGDVYYIVMEYVEGRSLKEIISQEAPLPIDKAIDIAIMICDGVHCAHEKGIIHRDIKPHNIMITETGIVKVADFGIARAISSATITFGGNIVGSVHYISPEQAKGEPVNRTTDIYSIGCVLYEMITGQVPFNAESAITVALKHIHDEVMPPHLLNEAVPLNLEAVVLKAMDKVSGRRFLTAQEMRNNLLNLHSSNINAYNNRNNKNIVMSPVKHERNEDSLKKKKLKPTGIVLIVIAIVGLLSGLFFRMSDGLFGAEVTVPNVESLNIKEANQTLKDAGLIMRIIAQQPDEQIEKDSVISQNPTKGQKVKKGREVKVIISTGTEEQKVPNLIGYNVNEAEVLLKNKGLKIGISETFDEKHAENEVISQNPEAGSRVANGSKVNVVISKGAEKKRIVMPNLVGLSQAEAEIKLKENNLVLGEVRKQESTDYYADKVISQDTTPGVLVEEQTSINLVVSKGARPSAQTKVLKFTLPSDQENYIVVIKVTDSQGQREVYKQSHPSSDTVSVGVVYVGNGSAEVLLDGKHYKTIPL